MYQLKPISRRVLFFLLQKKRERERRKTIWVLTRLANRKHNVPLQNKRHTIKMRHAALRAPKARDLQEGWHGERPQLAVHLHDRAVRGCLGPKRLVVNRVHAFGREFVFPPVDYPGRRNVCICVCVLNLCMYTDVKGKNSWIGWEVIG